MRAGGVIALMALLALSPRVGAQPDVEECRAPSIPFGGASGTPVSVVDNVTVTEAVTITDLNVLLQITHGFVGDIGVDLESPAGTILRLHDELGGDSDDIDLIYSDQGVANGLEPYDFGCYMQASGAGGVGSLADFAGESTVGSWSLTVSDAFPAQTDGVLEEWCLRAFATPTFLVPSINDLACSPTADGAELTWSNPITFDAITVTVSGVASVLPGSAASFTIAGQTPGVTLEVSVAGTLSGGAESCPETCTVAPLGAPPPPLTEKMVLVIVDGLRYSEGLGDPTRAHVPNMDALATQGTIIEPFLNDGPTVTVRAIPAILCGSWDPPVPFFDPDCDEDNQYSPVPFVHEAFRQQLDRPAEDCSYVLGPYCPWRGSFHPSYGPDYWPQWVQTAGGDDDNWVAAQDILANESPTFLTFYLPDVDGAGHSGDWDAYIAAIENADQIIGELWSWLQQDPEYAGVTTMLITNDHGRHDYDFQGHGDGCVGCRTIQLLAVGPGIKSGFVSSVPRAIPDVAPTIAALLGFQTELADGEVMTEILETVEFVRGDANDDGVVGLADAMAILDLVFGGATLTCQDAADANDDGAVDVSDAITDLGYLFGVDPAPPPPFPGCGPDGATDTLDCSPGAACP